MGAITPEQFGRIGWICFHKFHGLGYKSCPMCGANIVMHSAERCAQPNKRGNECWVKRYPFVKLSDVRCPNSSKAKECIIGGKCSVKGSAIPFYQSTRLLPVKGKLRWVNTFTVPIYSRKRKGRIIGAMDTVNDVTEMQDALLDKEQMEGKITLCERLEPVLHIVKWLGYDRCRIFVRSTDGRDLIAEAQIGGGAKNRSQ